MEKENDGMKNRALEDKERRSMEDTVEDGHTLSSDNLGSGQCNEDHRQRRQ